MSKSSHTLQNAVRALLSHAFSRNLERRHLRPTFTLLLVAVIAVAGFSLFAGSASAATYYVSTNGNDTNNGTSLDTPWAHHPWDSNATGTSAAIIIQPGDIINMKRGDTWYDVHLTTKQAGTASNPITTTSTSTWGSGEAVLSGAYNPTSLTWTTDGTGYKATVAAMPNVVVYDTTQLTLASGATNTVSLNHYDWSSANGGTLWVNVGEAPTTGSIQVSKRNDIMEPDKDYLTFSHLTLQSVNNTNSGVAFITSANTILDTVTIKWFNMYGLYLYTCSNIQIVNSTIASNGVGQRGIQSISCPGVTLDNNDISGTTTYGIVLDAASSNNAQISNNRVYNVTQYGIRFSGSGAQVYNNSVHDNGTIGLYMSSSNNAHVYSNTIYAHTSGYYNTGAGSGIYIDGSSSNNAIYRNNIYRNYVGIEVTLPSGTSGNQIYYNIVRDSTVNDMDLSNEPSSANPTNEFNNTVIHNPSGSNVPPYTGHGMSIQLNGQKVKYANNVIIIRQTADNNQGMCIAGPYIQAWTDYNWYYDATSGHNAHLGKIDTTNYDTLSSWKATAQANSRITDLNGVSASAESNSLSGDPRINDLNGYDFTLQSSSPAIDAGSDVGLATDYAGNPIYGAPDIGAYEYQPPHNLAIATPDTIDIGGGARIYADGKFRDLGITSGTTAKLSITPQSGSLTTYGATDTRPAWLDITNITWATDSKSWTESNAQSSDMVTKHTVGDLTPNTVYSVSVDGQMIGAYASDANGAISFTYSGGYSTHTFAVEYYPAGNSGGGGGGSYATADNDDNDDTYTAESDEDQDNDDEVANASETDEDSSDETSDQELIAQLQAKIQDLIAKINALKAQNQTQASSSSGSTLTEPLFYGSKGSQVVLLQNILQQQGFFPKEVNCNGRFGPTTLKAVQTFQVQNNIATAGSVGYGRVGPSTRAALNQLAE